jgi:hypothetical protein
MGQSLSAMAGSGMLPTPTMMDGVLASKAGGQIVNGRRVTDKGESFSVKLGLKKLQECSMHTIAQESSVNV